MRSAARVGVDDPALAALHKCSVNCAAWAKNMEVDPTFARGVLAGKRPFHAKYVIALPRAIRAVYDAITQPDCGGARLPQALAAPRMLELAIAVFQARDADPEEYDRCVGKLVAFCAQQMGPR